MSQSAMQEQLQLEIPSENVKKLLLLQQLLRNNREIQAKLKRNRDAIIERLQMMDEYISTYRLKMEHPSFTSILSYVKFDRSLSQVFKDRVKVVETEVHKLHEDQTFYKNLKENEGGNSKRKMNKSINFEILPTDSAQIDFQQMARKFNYKMGIDFFQDWLVAKRPKNLKMPYTIEEQKKIVALQTKYGTSWQKICSFLQLRTLDEIYYEFHNRLNPKITNGRWTTRQSLMLILLLQHYGTKKWGLVGEKMVVKSELQSRQRYSNILNPSLGRDSNWTRQMQSVLMQVAPELNFCWNKIAKMSIFNNKTDNCIWRKYRSMVIKKNAEQIQEIIPSSKKSLLEKILKYKTVNEKRKKKGRPEISIVFDPNSKARSNRSLLQTPISIREVQSVAMTSQIKMEIEIDESQSYS